MNMNFDLTIPELAYMFGFFQADGHLSQDTRDRGKFRIELSKRDEHILYDFQKLIPEYSSIKYRTRDTNFKDNYECCVLTISDLSFRDLLCSMGIPYGIKSEIIKPPVNPYSRIDYIRGLIDGNGSVGLTERGFPLISLTTYSDFTAIDYKKFIFEHTGMVNNTNRNKRDNIYNIGMLKEDAQKLCIILYPPGCLCLKRKFEEVQKLLQWKRPDNWRKKSVQKGWTEDQDNYIKSHSMQESMDSLKRSKQSVSLRLWRLKKCTK